MVFTQYLVKAFFAGHYIHGKAHAAQLLYSCFLLFTQDALAIGPLELDEVQAATRYEQDAVGQAGDARCQPLVEAAPESTGQLYALALKVFLKHGDDAFRCQQLRTFPV